MRRVALGAGIFCAAAVLALGAAYVTNGAPVVPAVAAEAARTSGKPFVVKLHAQWCPVCMVTKDVWSRIEEAYADRVHLVVLDFTDQERSDASVAEATRLGLTALLDEFYGATGTVVVMNGRTRDVAAAITGRREYDVYRDAIDAALAASAR